MKFVRGVQTQNKNGLFEDKKDLIFLESKCIKYKILPRPQPKYKSKQISKSYSYPKVAEKQMSQCSKYSEKYNMHADTKQIITLYSKRNTHEIINKINKRFFQTDWYVYRCQLSSKEESCCCSCNSDAMFEVMKSLYDCYKRKNCDNCKCILCCHLPVEMREIGIAMVSDTDKKEKLKKALADMLGKTPEEKEKILRELAMANIALPEPRTPSETGLIKKVRKALGLTPEPENTAERAKLKKAEIAGVGVIPLEGKTLDQKYKILKDIFDMGILLPEGRTPSEMALINKIKAGESYEKFYAAKSPQEKGKILQDLTDRGIPLPEGKTLSEKAVITKIKSLKPAPPSQKMRSIKAAGLITPLKGKTSEQKEKILKGLADRGIPLPEGRTPSEKSLIAKVKGSLAARKPSEKLQKAKIPGLITPLTGKTPEQKEKVLKGLAMTGLPLPEGKTPSEKKLIDKIRADLGLPLEPKSPSMREKYNKAANEGALVPLEGKSPAEKEKILRNLIDRGITLPEGRTPSEKSLIAKLKSTHQPKGSASEKLRKARGLGLLSPLVGKTPEQKEKILKDSAMAGLPLPEGKTPSEKKLIDKVRAYVGLPLEPKTLSMREKYNKAATEGALIPLGEKSPAEKEKILQNLVTRGIPLPEGRTPSEKALIAKVKASPHLRGLPSEKLRKSKALGLATPLAGKTTEQKENKIKDLALAGQPLPEGQTPSEIKLINKVRTDLGLPPEPKSPSLREKYDKAVIDGLLVPLEGKTTAEKQKNLQNLADRGIPLPEGRTPSEKSMIAKIKQKPRVSSENLRKARAAGIITTLTGKTPEEKENIVKRLAMEGQPLPEAKTPSEKKLIDKIRAEMNLPVEPKSLRRKTRGPPALPPGERKILDDKTAKVMKEGKGPADECICGLLTPTFDKSLGRRLSDKINDAKAAGVMTPLEGKTPEQKEKILKGLAKRGLPLPESKTQSEKQLIAKVRAQFGLPPEPRTPSLKQKYAQAQALGLLTPLEGKTATQKEKNLKALADNGIPLPEGRTPSEKAMIAAIRGRPKSVTLNAEKLRKARAAGLITPLSGKSPAQKEKILRELVAAGLPLPEARSLSDAEIIKNVKADTGYVTPTSSEKLRKAQAAGLLTPLAGKTPSTIGKLVRARLAAGLPLPEDAMPSEKSIINRERLKYAKTAGFLTPLKGKTLEQKEKILRGLAKAGFPLPDAKTLSEVALVNKIKNEYLPKTPSKTRKTSSEKLTQAKAAGLITPLAGKTLEQKEKIIRGLAKAGLSLPEGNTLSENDLIYKIRNELGLPPEGKTPSIKEKLRKAYDTGLITTFEGKSLKEKEKILNNYIKVGIPLPEGNTPSEKALIAKLKGIPLSKTPLEKVSKAKTTGLITSLEGKSQFEKEQIIISLARAGLPLPEGKTASEKYLINKIRTELGIPPPAVTPSEKEVVRKARDDGILTPLAGKSKKEKEKILRGLAEAGLPLPMGTSVSEKSLVKKIRAEVGLSLEPTPSEKRGKIRTKTKRVGVIKTKIKGEGEEEFEEIIKTSKCDRACGCDKKKIKFKHSYVKIRVTSPDLSSICPCPDECFPPIKTGVITDSEGIKVTVGRAVGVPSYSTHKPHTSTSTKFNNSTNEIVFAKRFSDSKIGYISSRIDSPVDMTTTPDKLDQSIVGNYYSEVYGKKDQIKYIMKYRTSSDSCENTCASGHSYSIEDYNSMVLVNLLSNVVKTKWFEESDRSRETFSEPSIACFSKPFTISLKSKHFSVNGSYTPPSSQSLLIVRTESSLCLCPGRNLSTISFKLSTTLLDDEYSSSNCSSYICYTNSSYTNNNKQQYL